MKRFLVYLILVAVLGCKEVTYKEPQPKGVERLRSIPHTLQGSYVLPEDNRATRDTLVVLSGRYYASSDPQGGSVLSDSLMIKYYQGYYFININDKPEWLLRVIQQEKNGDINCYMLQEKDSVFNDMLRHLSKEIKIDSVKLQNETLYQIDPSPEKLISLLKNGYFKKTATLKKID
jgi:hypothetical protein